METYTLIIFSIFIFIILISRNWKRHKIFFVFQQGMNIFFNVSSSCWKAVTHQRKISVFIESFRGYWSLLLKFIVFEQAMISWLEQKRRKKQSIDKIYSCKTTASILSWIYFRSMIEYVMTTNILWPRRIWWIQTQNRNEMNFRPI